MTFTTDVRNDSGLTRKITEIQKNIDDDYFHRDPNDSEYTQEEKPDIFRQPIHDETEVIDKIRVDFFEREEKMQQIKKVELFHVGKGVMQNTNPKLTHVNECIKDREVAKPLIENLHNQTLVLRELALSKGQSRGLAKAIPLLKNNEFTKLFIDNCNLTGDQFSEILEATAQHKNFKSIIYRKNHVNMDAIVSLDSFHNRRAPNHLHELKFFDCNLSSTMIQRLMLEMTEANTKLRSLAIVGNPQTNESLKSMIHFVSESNFLRELDLSWTSVQPSQWLDLLESVKNHVSLRKLNLSHNRLTEKQPLMLTEDQKKKGLTQVPLLEANVKLAELLVELLTNNQNLIHLNFDFTGLFRLHVEALISTL